MMKVNEYNGYKVKCGEQFPTYCPTYDKAQTAAWMYTKTTGNNAEIYGIADNGDNHYLMTTHKNAPRT